MHAAQLRLPFVFPYFSQLALPRRLIGRTKRAANSHTEAFARAASASRSSDADQLDVSANLGKDELNTLAASEAFVLTLAKAQAPGFDHRAEFARLLSFECGPDESPDDLANGLLQRLARVQTRKAK